MPYASCLYVCRAGLCGKACWAGHKDGDRCGVHRARQSLTWFGKGCGRATKSVTGFCNKCGWAQNDGCKNVRLQAKEMDAQTQRDRDEMDAYIDYLLSWDWSASSCLTPLKTLPTAPCATSG